MDARQADPSLAVAPAPIVPGAAVPDASAPAPGAVRAQVKDLSFYYGAHQALKHLNLPIAERRVTALIGPSGCGKSTFLRCFNRMHDLQPGTRYEGSIILHPENIDLVGRDVDPIDVRMRIGMVFQKPNPFPVSIADNVTYGLRLRGMKSRAQLANAVEQALRAAALWDEVKDRLHASALDPIATAKIEELITALREQVTVLIVTHNMQQAARISDFTAFMFLGELVEYATTATLFTNPSQKRTEDYITGRYG